MVAIALGELSQCIQHNEAHLVLTDTLRAFVAEIDWNRPPGPQGLIREIYLLLNQWFLQQHDGLVVVNVENVGGYQPHPVPLGCQTQGLVELWADELGRILYLHDRACKANEFFVGVACACAFAGKECGSYLNTQDRRVLPLVGPTTLSDLCDAYDWYVSPNIHLRNVSFEEARKNCGAVGAECVLKPKSGSHYKVKFKGNRSWPLDSNNDPIPERFLKELIPITGLPLPVIKMALTTGTLPQRVLRFSKH
jgi:hypothetical protein